MVNVSSMPRKPAAPATGGALDRPLRADAQRNRQRVIEAAIEAFASSGIAVPMDEIAEAAGVGVGTLYRHFPTKEALFAAVVRHHLEVLIAEAEQLASAEDPGKALFGFFGRMVEEVSSKRDVIEALNQAGVDFDSTSGALKEEFSETVCVLVQRARRAGAIRGDVADQEVMSLLAGTCMGAAHLGPAGDCRRMVAVICDGLRAAQAKVAPS